MVKCTENSFCGPLETRLQNYKTGGVKGFLRQTKESGRVIPSYSIGRADRGLAFKFCPFCGFSFRETNPNKTPTPT